MIKLKRKIKIFLFPGSANEMEIEETIDRWMDMNPNIHIVQIVATDSSSQMGYRSPALYVLYEDMITEEGILNS